MEIQWSFPEMPLLNSWDTIDTLSLTTEVFPDEVKKESVSVAIDAYPKVVINVLPIITIKGDILGNLLWFTEFTSGFVGDEKLEVVWLERSVVQTDHLDPCLIDNIHGRSNDLISTERIWKNLLKLTYNTCHSNWPIVSHVSSRNDQSHNCFVGRTD